MKMKAPLLKLKIENDFVKKEFFDKSSKKS